MNNHDNKQYQLMASYIVELEQGEVKISQLIELLDGLLHSLEDTEENWTDRFRSEWWTLEQIYAVAVDRGENSLNSENENFVYEAIENMKILLDIVCISTVFSEK